MILLDTSFLFALNNRGDKNYRSAVSLVHTIDEPMALPIPVLSELCYLLHSRIGHHAMRRFLRGLDGSDIQLMSLTNHDMQRVVSLLDQYAQVRLDFADAAIVALAEQLGITQIATFDRRDFSIIRPRHTAFFELLP